MSTKTPGQAAYEARQGSKARRMGGPGTASDSELAAIIGLRWEELPAGMQADEETGAKAAASLKQPAELRAAMGETRDLRKVAAEVLATFLPSGSGHVSRVGQAQIRKWRERAGLETQA